MAAELIIRVTPQGGLHFVYDDELVPLLDLGASSIRRASHVEPAPGGWTADLSPVGGPVLGPFILRAQALAAERRWLEEDDHATIF